MAYCVKCGAKVEDYARNCSQCGAEIPDQRQRQEYTYEQNDYHQNQNGQYSYGQEDSHNANGFGGYTQHNTSVGYGPGYFDRNDVQQNKLMGILSYLGILVFIPILAGNRDSEYVRFHMNQGLVLFIISAVSNIIVGDWFFMGLHSIFNFGGSAFGWIFELIDIAVAVFLIIGIVYACKGVRKELPIIGQIKIFK